VIYFACRVDDMLGRLEPKLALDSNHCAVVSLALSWECRHPFFCTHERSPHPELKKFPVKIYISSNSATEPTQRTPGI
jgi:hypothetical protein